ncbi:MAG: winged helix-turn-helix transcriptional regulator [bacterium]|nr:winged helix-turn-helix transcriptional regulator [bacterium]
MWQTIEQNIDGMVGRMMSWLMQAPVRLTAVAEKPSKPVAETIVEVAEEITKVQGEVEATTSEAAEAAEDSAEETAEQVDEALEEQDQKIVEALVADGFDAGASMKELTSRIGETAYAVRQRMNRLIEAGVVQRKGKGMRTRYHRVAK